MDLFIYCFREFDEKNYFDEFCHAHHLTYRYTTEYPSLETVELARGCDAISLTPTAMNADLLKKFQEIGVRYILTRSIGYDHIDLAAAKALDMHVSHVQYQSATVADYAIMLMMMSLRKMTTILDTAKIQDFSLQGKMGKNLQECTVGVIGTGKIGKTVIQHLSGFGCSILAYDPHVNPEISTLCHYVDLPTLLQQSDVLTLHIPAKAENTHLLNQETFRLMKKGVVIVNTARGSLIDTDALIANLENGQVGGAALDVLEDETNLYYFNRSGDCLTNRQLAILRSFPTVILTPHIAFYTENVVRGMVEHTINCLLAMKNEQPDPLILF